MHLSYMFPCSSIQTSCTYRMHLHLLLHTFLCIHIITLYHTHSIFSHSYFIIIIFVNAHTSHTIFIIFLMHIPYALSFTFNILKVIHIYILLCTNHMYCLTSSHLLYILLSTYHMHYNTSFCIFSYTFFHMLKLYTILIRCTYQMQSDKHTNSLTKLLSNLIFKFYT